MEASSKSHYFDLNICSRFPAGDWPRRATARHGDLQLNDGRLTFRGGHAPLNFFGRQLVAIGQDATQFGLSIAVGIIPAARGVILLLGWVEHKDGKATISNWDHCHDRLAHRALPLLNRRNVTGIRPHRQLLCADRLAMTSIVSLPCHRRPGPQVIAMEARAQELAFGVMRRGHLPPRADPYAVP
jgi:hypothetical protein